MEREKNKEEYGNKDILDIEEDYILGIMKKNNLIDGNKRNGMDEEELFIYLNG